MGTSRNDHSPSTPPWRIAQAVLGTPDTSPGRQCVEIWRAAAADRGQRLQRDFSNEVFAAACQLASGRSAADAVASYNQLSRNVTEGGLVVDMGRRALARTAAENGGAGMFAAELFSEAVSYYASRDLASYVGSPGRIANSSEAIRLKESLRSVTKEKVSAVGEPGLSPRGWSIYVARVLKALVSRRESE